MPRRPRLSLAVPVACAVIALQLGILLGMTCSPAVAQVSPPETAETGGNSLDAPSAGLPVGGLPRTGGDLVALHAACRDNPPNDPGEAQRACHGYPAGVLTGVIALSRMTGQPLPFCLPQDITDERILGAIRDFTVLTPGAGDLPAALVILAAASDSFPCRSGAGPTSPPAEDLPYPEPGSVSVPPAR